MIATRRWLLLCLAIMLGSVPGCFGLGNRFPKDPSITPVGGIVTLDGVPADKMRVTACKVEYWDEIVSGKLRRGFSATTDAKGAFVFTTTYAKDGLAPGDYKIYISWLEPGALMMLDEGGELEPSLVSPNYMDFYEKYKPGGPGNVDLKVEARKPQTNLKFDLTSK